MTTPRVEPGAVTIGVALASPGQLLLAVFFGLAFVALALVDALEVDLVALLVAVDFAAEALVAGLDALVAAVVDPLSAAAASAAFAAAASARADLLSAARALPAAVWAPLALTDFPAAMRALAAFAAAVLPVALVTRPEVAACVPPRAALILIVRRDLRRAAAFGWMAPALAARSSADRASIKATVVASASVGPAATLRALAT